MLFLNKYHCKNLLNNNINKNGIITNRSTLKCKYCYKKGHKKEKC